MIFVNSLDSLDFCPQGKETQILLLALLAKSKLSQPTEIHICGYTNSLAADGVGPRNVVGSKLLKLLIFTFSLGKRNVLISLAVERSLRVRRALSRGPRELRERVGRAEAQVASMLRTTFIAILLPNASCRYIKKRSLLPNAISPLIDIVVLFFLVSSLDSLDLCP